MNYRLKVTRFDAESATIIQNDVFAHGSNLKHGLQRKSTTAILNEDYRAAFEHAKWTNESITIGDDSLTMMHKTAFAVDYTMQLTLQQVDDDVELTVKTAARQVNTDKQAFAVEIQSQADGQLNVDSSDVIYAANINAAKLQINGEYEAYEGKWSKMPYGGIYRNNAETGQIVVLREITAEEAAELAETESE